MWGETPRALFVKTLERLPGGVTSISCPRSDLNVASGLNAPSLCHHERASKVGGRSTAGALCTPTCTGPGGPGLDLHCQSLVSEGCLLSRYSSRKGLRGRMLGLRAGGGRGGQAGAGSFMSYKASQASVGQASAEFTVQLRDRASLRMLAMETTGDIPPHLGRIACHPAVVLTTCKFRGTVPSEPALTSDTARCIWGPRATYNSD